VTSALEQLQSVLSCIPVGVVATDVEGRTTFQNPEASRILGVSWETARGRALAAALGSQHPLCDLAREALRSRRLVARHACEVLQLPIGQPLVVDLAAAPLGVEEEVEGVVITLTDRTVGRALEELVLLRRRTEEFAQLAAGIAHEIRNPLGGIHGAAQLLLQKLEDPGLGRYPELIRAETDRIRRLLDDLAQLTRGEDLTPRPTNLHRVLDDLLQLHRSDPEWQEVEFLREYDPSIPEIEIDPDRVAQVILNLLRNAVHAVGGKGRVLVRTRVETQFQLSPGAGPPRGVVHLEVQDDGPGIPESDLPHIFTPFFTRSDRGTGLGLAIAQHWAVRHGGRVRAYSAPGEGTRMRVTLPLRTGPAR
jgi:two-component system nitrogen regulation sensor histidine kinase GlnL